jgi:hypothetical protein
MNEAGGARMPRMLTLTMMEAEIKRDALSRTSRKYAHAPITEAIIEIRVTPTARVTGLTCKKAFEAIKTDFPETTDLMQMQAEIMGGQQIGAHATQKMIGCARTSKERHQVPQRRRSGSHSVNCPLMIPGTHSVRPRNRSGNCMRPRSSQRALRGLQRDSLIESNYLSQLGNCPSIFGQLQCFRQKCLKTRSLEPSAAPTPAEGFRLPCPPRFGDFTAG